MTDYFTVFGLPRKLTVDADALQRRFYELSREHHPDFHQGTDAARQAEALARSALVNRAYRALRDPLLERGAEDVEVLGLYAVRDVTPSEILEERNEAFGLAQTFDGDAQRV